jgi:PAS domain S-box-containing protein
MSLKSGAKDTSSSTDTYSISLFSDSCGLHKSDAGSLILALIVVALCLAACLISFFVVRQQDSVDARASLDTIQARALSALQISLDNSFVYIQSVANFFQYSLTEVDFMQQFMPLVNAQGFPSFVTGLYYGEKVLNADKTAFTQKMRAKGGLYANFTIHKEFVVPGASSTRPFVPYTAPEYYPITMSVGPWTFAPPFIGWDWYTVSANVDTLEKLNTTGKFSLAEVVPVLLPNSTSPPLRMRSSVVVMIPIFNRTTKAFTSFISGSLFIENIINQGLDAKIISDINVAVYDTNSTSNGGLVHTSNSYFYNSDILPLLSAAPFRSEVTIPVVDRIYRIVFWPTQNFIAAHSGINKYIGIIISIIACLILLCACLALFFINRLRLSMKQRDNSRRHLTSLKDTYSKTQTLLTRLAKQEAKARATVDSVIDFVVIVNNAGRILHANSSFDRMFGYSENNLQKGLQLTTVFCLLDSRFYSDEKYLSNDQKEIYIHTNATTNEGRDIPSAIIIKSLNIEKVKKIDETPSDVTVTIDSPHPEEDEEAYAIVGRPLEQIQAKTIIEVFPKQ